MDGVLMDRASMNGRRIPQYTGIGLYGSRPPPVYHSLPPPPLCQQPPLLPLPFATLPSPATRIAAVRPRRRQKKKPKPKGARSDPDPVAVKAVGEEKVGENIKDDLVERSRYSISPPPSSVPLPRFVLAKPKAIASCGVEAMGGDADDPRSILRSL